MKIEKLNENQIRCTLTRSDLADRELKLSELAYGSEKAKSLFRDMMEQASHECGFEADDIPLMIEAVPISAECVVLTVTKVDDPEELDTRFSQFAPTVHVDTDENEDEEPDEQLDAELTELFNKVHGIGKAAPTPGQPSKLSSQTVFHSVYAFSDLAHVIRLSHVVSDFPLGRNSLYKDRTNGEYRLIVAGTDMPAESFNRLCNILSEYGKQVKNSSGGEAYLKEHFESICLNHALQSLAMI